MARVVVEQAEVVDGALKRLQVRLGGHLTRTIDRDQVVSWLQDHHTLVAGDVALQLVGVDDGDETAWFIRTDNALTAEDLLPRLPSLG